MNDDDSYATRRREPRLKRDRTQRRWTTHDGAGAPLLALTAAAVAYVSMRVPDRVPVFSRGFL